MLIGERDIVVIGAGLAGSVAALSLARRGRRVTLLERDAVAMNRASLRNEGKIHLGLIYAAEPGALTARRQLEGALSFRRILRELAGEAVDGLAVARPFAYLVPQNSLLGPEALEAHFDALAGLCAARLAADPRADYLGRRPRRLARRMSEAAVAVHFDARRFRAGYMTAELAIDTIALAAVLRDALAGTPGVELLTSRRVREAWRLGEGFVLGGDGAAGPWRLRAAQVVNAAWDDLYRLDAAAGPAPPPGWLHRLKYRVLARLPAALERAPSATLLLGRYGDVVVRPGGLSFLSWYPAGLRGWTGDLAPPDDWDGPCRGAPDPGTAARTARAILDAIGRWMPGAEDAAIEFVDAGAILAHGATDVDDPASGLHGRTVCGVTSREGWHSLNPGKLTTAPLHGVEAADAVDALAGHRPAVSHAR